MEKKLFVVLSLFDGISCGQIALNKLISKWMEYEYIYYASEIEKSAIEIAKNHFPNTIHVGDIRNLNVLDKNTIKHVIDLLIGGSPCQSLSFMGKRKGLKQKENIEITTLEQYLELKNNGFEFEGQSYLFWEFVRILKETKPKYFLLENVRMDKRWKDIISQVLGVEPIEINSSLLTAQNRNRLYWTNIPNISQPKDKGILLSHIIPNAKGFGYRGRKNKYSGKYEYFGTIRKDGKSNCIVTNKCGTQMVIFPNYEERNLTINEAEKLQGIPIDYTKFSNEKIDTERYKMIGNGWTIPVIEHIFNNIPL